jgi:hypothetical protein
MAEQNLIDCHIVIDTETGHLHAKCEAPFLAHVERVQQLLTAHTMATEAAPVTAEVEILPEAPTG